MKKIFQLYILICAIYTASANKLEDSFIPLQGPYGGNIQSIVYDNHGTIYASSLNDVFVSKDNGNSWQKISTQYANTSGFTCFRAVSSTGLVYGNMYWPELGAYRNGSMNFFNGGEQVENLSITDTIEGKEFPESNIEAWVDFKSIVLVDNKTIFGGVVFKENGTFADYAVLRSTNAGTTWKRVVIDASDYDVANMKYDNKGTLYILSRRAGIYYSVSNGDNWELIKYDLEKMGPVSSFEVSSGALYCGTNMGLFVTDDFGKTWIKLSEIFKTTISAIYFGPKGTLYIITPKNIYISNDNGKTISESTLGFKSQWVMSLVFVENGRILAATYKDGIYMSDDGGYNWVPSNTGLGQLFPKTAIADNEGNILVGTYRNGLYKYSSLNKSWNYIDNIVFMPLMKVKKLLKSNNSIFSCTERDGIYISNDQGKEWKSYDFGGYTSTNDFIVLNNGSFIASMANSTALDQVMFGLPLSNEVYKLFTSKNNGESWEPESKGLDSLQVISLTQGKNYLYALAQAINQETSPDQESGIYVSKDNGSSWELYKNGLGLSAASVLADGSRLYIGTSDRGISYIEEGTDEIVNDSIITSNQSFSPIKQIVSNGNGSFAAIDDFNRIYYKSGMSPWKMSPDSGEIVIIEGNTSASYNIALTNNGYLLLLTDNQVWQSKKPLREW